MRSWSCECLLCDGAVEPIEKKRHFPRACKVVGGERVRFLLPTDNNADAALFENAKCILVGFVIAQVHGQNLMPPAGTVEGFQDPQDCFSLVPSNIRSDFEDALAGGRPQQSAWIFLLYDPIAALEDIRHVFGGCQTVVHREAQFLILHDDAWNIAEGGAQNVVNLPQHSLE